MVAKVATPFELATTYFQVKKKVTLSEKKEKKRTNTRILNRKKIVVMIFVEHTRCYGFVLKVVGSLCLVACMTTQL